MDENGQPIDAIGDGNEEDADGVPSSARKEVIFDENLFGDTEELPDSDEEDDSENEESDDAEGEDNAEEPCSSGLKASNNANRDVTPDIDKTMKDKLKI